MKNTTFKRRALISSIAMLLVALVALGSATFAWFAANPNASASGLSMKTTASTGLVIKTDSDTEWDHTADLYKDQSTPFDLQPVSQEQTNAANFWKVDAAAASAYGAGSGVMDGAGVGGFNGGSSLSTGAVYAEKIYFRLSDGSDATAASSKKVQLTKVTITKATGNTSDLSNGIRVAIAKADGTLVGTYALATGTANGTLTTASKTSGSFSPALSVQGAAITTDTGLTGLSADATDESKALTVYVYLDGQDSKVFSDNVGTVNAAEIISKVQLDFKLV